MLAQQLPDQEPVTDPRADLDLAREQVDRILASDTLRGSEVLRRMFRFLANKTFSGEADQLKEYSVGLDALGKPASYDPRQDASARLQASRLRQKLEEYYHAEGVNDPLTIELPRGRFKVVWRHRVAETVPSEPVALPRESTPPEESGAVARWRRLAVTLAITSVLMLCVSVWAVVRIARTPTANLPAPTPELDALWRPFISSAHHLIIAVSNPVFVRFQRDGRPDILSPQKDVAEWNHEGGAPEFTALKRLLGYPQASVSFEYAPRGELDATFALSQYLAPHRRDVSVTKVDQLTWQQFADNDVIFLAPRETVAEKERSLPVNLAFLADRSGIQNLQPQPGERGTYIGSQSQHDSSGEIFELVSMMPGPLGRTTVASFTGGGAWGVIGTIQSLMDPSFARVVVQALKGRSGIMPSAYQVVIRVSYHDGTPTNAAYVTHRVLSFARNSTEPALR